MNIETLLHKEIQTELNDLKELKIGTDDHEKAVKTVATLMDKAIEMKRLGNEDKDKAEEKKDRLFRNIISVAGVVIPVIVTVWGTNKTLKFEETGTVTTIMGRGFINKLLPKK